MAERRDRDVVSVSPDTVAADRQPGMIDQEWSMARPLPREPLPLMAVGPGIVVVRQGEPVRRPLVVVSGALRESCLSFEGDELFLGVLGRGDLVTAADGRPATFTVRSLRTSRLRQAALTELPALTAERDRRLGGLACQLAWLDVTDRVQARLIDLAARFGREVAGGTLIDLFLTQEDLGALVGATRESANRALRSLAARGQLRTAGRGRYVVPPHLHAVSS
jgi:CRP/FNR family cyclic AMP-dependent transcriptional regulator